jgi:hypothetical protein
MPIDNIDLRVKHLEMIQSIISRLGAYGANHKNYCITLVTAAFGLAIALQRPWVAALALAPIAVFAGLDAQYLRIERRYRALFDQVRLEPMDVMTTFDLGTGKTSKVGFWRTLSSWSILAFYLPMLIGTGLVVLIAEVTYG